MVFSLLMMSFTKLLSQNLQDETRAMIPFDLDQTEPREALQHSADAGRRDAKALGERVGAGRRVAALQLIDGLEVVLGLAGEFVLRLGCCTR